MFLGVSVTGEVHKLPTHKRAKGEEEAEKLGEECWDLFSQSGSSVVSKEEKIWKMEETENLGWGLQCFPPLSKEHSRQRSEP